MSMFHKLGMAAAALVSTVALSTAASSEALTPFNLDFRPFVLGQPLNQNDFGQDNYFWGFGANLDNPSPGTFGNWVTLGMPQFNADDTGDVFLVTPDVVRWATLAAHLRAASAAAFIPSSTLLRSDSPVPQTTGQEDR
jgi:hypothetical protein